MGLLEQWTGYLLAVLILLLAYQQWRLIRFRQHLAKREELFRIVTENAADMIALVDMKGRRLYNSPAYEKILGYSAEDLAKTSIFEQVHPEDRPKVLDASREARRTGVGKKLEYRVRHKDGTWRVLESTASAIRGADGDVDKLVIINRDVTQRKWVEEQKEHDSFRDPLTGLPNRLLFLDRLQNSFARALRDPQYQYAVLFVGVDDPLEAREPLGPAARDELILEIGHRIARCLRSDDPSTRVESRALLTDAVLSRTGDEGFAILLEGTGDPSDAMRIAKRIQTALDVPCKTSDREVRLDASLGIALRTAAQERAEDVLHDAEAAMRRAKALGGSRCQVFQEGMHTQAVKHLRIEGELRDALAHNQFRLWYQPIVHLQSRQAAGFEALVRWQHPTLGLISPYEFIEVAEDAGQIVAIGQWVLREACRQIRAWQSKFPHLEPLHMTVNVSATQLAHANLVADVRAALQESGVEPSHLQMELPENVAMADPLRASEILSQLKHLGILISIGDFGTGQCSLRWVRSLPLSELKIDRALVRNLPTDPCSRDIVHLTITVGHALQLRVVAQGIETAVQLNRLQQLGCEFGQGYLFSQPIDAQRADEMLQQQNLRARSAASTAKP